MRRAYLPGRATSRAQDPARRVTDAQQPLPRHSSGKRLPLAGRAAAAECPWDGGAGRRLSQGWVLASSRVRRKGGGAGLVLRAAAVRTWAL